MLTRTQLHAKYDTNNDAKLSCVAIIDHLNDDVYIVVAYDDDNARTLQNNVEIARRVYDFIIDCARDTLSFEMICNDHDIFDDETYERFQQWCSIEYL